MEVICYVHFTGSNLSSLPEIMCRKRLTFDHAQWREGYFQLIMSDKYIGGEGGNICVMS